MATYKKKGQKKIQKNTVNKIEEESTTAEVFKNLEESASKSEQWIEKNQKPLFTSLIVIVAVILGYLAYNNFVVEPKEKEAADELAYPKVNFELAQNSKDAVTADSLYVLALEGSDGKFGFVDIADKYSATKAGNLANYFAGISYLNINEYDKAISYLEDFSSDDALLGPTAIGVIGDAFANLEQNEDALNYYLKAANKNQNSATTPLFLFKAGNIAIVLGKNEKAVELFTSIKEDYSTSSFANNIEMHINKAKYAK